MARAVVIVALACGIAHADGAKLDEARRAITDVRYDDAQRLLGEALREGDNSPAALADIYRLAASTAIVLEQPDVAQRYYERLLALDPGAQVPTDLAPKLREPFIAAQAAMQAKGSLSIRIARDGNDVAVEVANDPLAMAVAIAVTSADGRSPAFNIGADHRARIAAPWHSTLLVLDDTGNHLREIPIGDPEAAVPPQASEPAHVPRGWAIATVTFAVIAGGFGIAAISIDGEVGQEVQQSETHHLSDVQSLHSLERVFIGVTIGAGAAMIACAIPLTVSLFRHNDTWVAPSMSGLGLTVGGRW